MLLVLVPDIFVAAFVLHYPVFMILLVAVKASAVHEQRLFGNLPVAALTYVRRHTCSLSIVIARDARLRRSGLNSDHKFDVESDFFCSSSRSGYELMLQVRVRSKLLPVFVLHRLYDHLAGSL